MPFQTFEGLALVGKSVGDFWIMFIPLIILLLFATIFVFVIMMIAAILPNLVLAEKLI